MKFASSPTFSSGTTYAGPPALPSDMNVSFVVYLLSVYLLKIDKLLPEVH